MYHARSRWVGAPDVVAYNAPGRRGGRASHHLPQRICIDQPLLDLQNAWRGQRVHILGNGPSLGEADLRSLASDRVIGVNASPLADDRLGRQADVYCVSDRRFLQVPEKARIADGAAGSLRVFAGYCSGLICDDDVQFVRVLGALGVSADPRQGIYHGGSVVCFAAQIALWAGAGQIVLHGCEFDYQQGRFYEAGRPDPRSARVAKRMIWLLTRVARSSGAVLYCAGPSRLLGDFGDRPIPGLRRYGPND